MRRMLATATAIILTGTAMAASANFPRSRSCHSPPTPDSSGLYVGGAAGYGFGKGNLGALKGGTIGPGNYWRYGICR